MNEKYTDYELSPSYKEEPCEFKVYVIKSYIEAGFSTSTDIIGYFSTKQKAIDYINSHNIRGQILIRPIHVK